MICFIQAASNSKFTTPSANQRTKTTNQVRLSKFLDETLEKQIMKAVGEMLTQSAIRKDPALCAVKEKEGVFSMEKE